MTNSEGLFTYIKSGEVAEVKHLLSTEPSLINVRGEWGCTPLHFAASGMNSDLVKILIESGADINARNDDGETPLFWAYTLDIARILLNAGAEVDAKDHHGQTALHDLAASGLVSESKLLIEHGANVNSKDNEGRTPLHLAAVSGAEEETTLLIRSGAELEIRDYRGETPLHSAVSANIMHHHLKFHLRTIETLIRHGADVNAKTDDAKTAMDLANTQRTHIVELLNRSGAK